MFSDDEGYVLEEDEKLIAVAKKEGIMYYLNCDQLTHQQINVVWSKQRESKKSVWHRRFGHLSEHGLRELVSHNCNNVKRERLSREYPKKTIIIQ